MAKKDVIIEKINGLEKNINLKFKSLHDKFDVFIEDDYKPLKKDVKVNNEFRTQAKGIIGAVAFVCTMFGSALVWIASKFGGSK